jgi:hypothetical protein
MCFFFSLIPATFWVVVGFFVLYTSTKAEGTLRKFGKVLAIWIFIIASFFPICGAYMTLSGNCPMEELIEEMDKDDEDNDIF